MITIKWFREGMMLMAMWLVGLTQIFFFIPISMRCSLLVERSQHWPWMLLLSWNICSMTRMEMSSYYLDPLLIIVRMRRLSLVKQKVVVNGRPSLCCSTNGWEIFYTWRDGYTYWVKLRPSTESHLAIHSGPRYWLGTCFQFLWWSCTEDEWEKHFSDPTEEWLVSQEVT